MKTRHHIKSTQQAHYTRAKKRIQNLVAFAYIAWHLPDLNMKFDYERR